MTQAALAIWLASLVAAGLFYTAGFLSARRQARTGGAGSRSWVPRADGADPSELDSFAGVMARACLDRGQGEVEEYASRLQAECDRLARQCDEQKKRAEQLLQERDAAKRCVAVLERQVDMSRQRVAEMGAERDTLVSQSRSLDNAVDQVRHELGLEMEALRSRAKEAIWLSQENETLRSGLREQERLTSQIRELQAEVAVLRAQGLRMPAARPKTVRPERHGANIGETGRNLERELVPLQSLQGFRSAALADELGLPIVGIGDYTSSLAAFAGFLGDIAAKARDFLPLGAVRRISLEDDNETTLAVSALEVDDSTLALVTLTIGPGPSTSEMAKVLQSAATMI